MFFVVVCVEWAVAGAGGVLLWLVVSFLCDVVCGADFRGIGCRLVFVVAGIGELVCGGVGVMGVGTVGVMDRGCAIKFSCGRAVVSVTTRFYRGGFAVNIL